MWKRLAFAIDAPPIIAYSASVEIRAEPAPYVAFLPHFLGAGSTPMTERPIAEKLFDGSPAFLHNRRFTGSAGSARGGRGSGRGGSHGSLLGCPCFDDSYSHRSNCNASEYYINSLTLL